MSWVKLSTKIGEAQTGFVEDKNILRNHFLPNLYRDILTFNIKQLDKWRVKKHSEDK